MDFITFKKLYIAAKSNDDFVLYAGSIVWDSWMEEESNIFISNTLKKIWTLANNSFEENRRLYKYSQKDFSDRCDIPLRTLQGWDSGSRVPPPYMKLFIDYSLFSGN